MLEPMTNTKRMMRIGMPRTKAKYVAALERAYMEGCLDTTIAIIGEENKRLEAEQEERLTQKRLITGRVAVLIAVAIVLLVVFQPSFTSLFKLAW